MYSENFLERFWAKIDRKKDDECWNWIASTAGNGYGQIKPDNGRGRRNLYAHRVVFEICCGEIPEGLEICHKCDNPRCCNPAHLFAGTRKDNAQDMARKMRSTWGSRSGTAKLSENDVREIRTLLGMGFAQLKIGILYGISQAEVHRIHVRKRWAHLV